MAITNTRISDLVPSEKILGQTVQVLFAEKNELVTSGLTARGDEVDAVANGGPRKASIPFLNPLSTDEVNISTDNISDVGSVGKLTADEFTVARHDLNYGWGTSDLARFVTQYDAKGGIQAGIGQYWNGIAMKYATSSMKGAVVANAALAVGDGTDAFSLDLVIDAAATGEMYSDQFDTLIISPNTRAKLQKVQANSYVPMASTDIGFDVWAGYKLVVSKAFGDTETMLCRSGALAFGVGAVPNAIEIERVANGGAGAGADILHSRQSIVVHPQGFNYKGAVAPNYTVLETAASWELAVPVDMVGFRLIKHTA